MCFHFCVHSLRGAYGTKLCHAWFCRKRVFFVGTEGCFGFGVCVLWCGVRLHAYGLEPSLLLQKTPPTPRTHTPCHTQYYAAPHTNPRSRKPHATHVTHHHPLKGQQQTFSSMLRPRSEILRTLAKNALPTRKAPAETFRKCFGFPIRA
jgi:hypothetical protein